MKDHELRETVWALGQRLGMVEANLAAVRLAHDALFDAVAEDLGYEVATMRTFNAPGFQFLEMPVTPKRPAVTVTPSTESVVRKPRKGDPK